MPKLKLNVHDKHVRCRKTYAYADVTQSLQLQEGKTEKYRQYDRITTITNTNLKTTARL